MRILLTRPKDDAEKIAALLTTHGHDVLVLPLLEIRFRDGPELSLDGVQAILATSANGVRALARRTKRRDLPIFAVGPQTAQAARGAGFAEIKSADGDGIALAKAVEKWTRPETGALFHARGAQSKTELAEMLTAAGFTVRSEILYEAAPMAQLPQDAVSALAAGALDAALFFSPRSARIFAEAVTAAGLADACRGLAALCISRATAAALAPLSFGAVKVAPHPDQAGLFALLG